MAAAMASSCVHVTTVGDYTKDDITAKQEQSRCDSCDERGPNLWACLHRDCLYVGCGENAADHSTHHFQERGSHCLTLNLTTLRVWCYLCECEVFLENNDPPLTGAISPVHRIASNRVYVADADSDDEEDGKGQNLKPRGLTGLQNLGNTCYMNAALQALSNCPQLTHFFLDCGAFVRVDKKPGLSKSYTRLVKEMWHKRRPSYVVPSGIAYGIKMVFPVFRGYMQQDAQEFLRCFMDQLHEELKEPLVEIESCSLTSPDSTDDFDSCQGESITAAFEESSQSEAEFETCDSGLSSEKSSCSEECAEAPEPLVADDDCSQAVTASAGPQVSSPRNQLSQRWSSEGIKDSKEGSCGTSKQPARPADLAHKSGGDWQSDSGVSGMQSPDTSTSDKKYASWVRSADRLAEHAWRSGHTVHSAKSSKSPAMQNQRGGLSPPPPVHVSLMQKPSARRRRPVQYRSVISDIFDGRILSSVQCLTCDTVSTTKETFQDLSLPIPNRDHLHMLHASQGGQQKGACPDVYIHQSWLSWMLGWMFSWFWGPRVSLQDCLAAFFSADELKGDNMYSCDKCKKLRNGIKYSKVLQLPEVLCIHLKRFRHEVMFSSKISSYVSFPLEGLDMSPFLHKDCSRGVTTYDLVAVICHHGTAGSGHYTAYSLNYLNEQWYEFDDQYVTAVDPQIVQNCEAYVLFYRKASEEMMKKRQRAVELMERSRNEPGLLQFYISKQWVNKFNTFAEPGPITNTDFLCMHGGVHPNKSHHVEDLCTVLSQGVWEYLHDTFGGGPPCNHLFNCPTCQAEQENLDRRRKQEHVTFVMLNKDYQAQESPPIVYAISMNWFRQWESFIMAKEHEPPGPVDNSPICHMKNSQAVLKMGSDYGSVSEGIWSFMHGIYGGGPEIVVQQNSMGHAPSTAHSTGSHTATPVSRSVSAAVGASHLTTASGSRQPSACPPSAADEPNPVPTTEKRQSSDGTTVMQMDDVSDEDMDRDCESQMIL